jgi:hypothetical protein
MEMFEAGERVSAMWLKLAEQIEHAVPDLVINDHPEDALRWATYAEACFWKATGEGLPHDLKDVLPGPTSPEDGRT